MANIKQSTKKEIKEAFELIKQIGEEGCNSLHCPHCNWGGCEGDPEKDFKKALRMIKKQLNI